MVDANDVDPLCRLADAVQQAVGTSVSAERADGSAFEALADAVWLARQVADANSRMAGTMRGGVPCSEPALGR